MKIVNKNYNLNSKLDKKIILISDIHYKEKRDLNRLNSILTNISKIKPDYICITGDLIDKCSILDEDDLLNWLKALSKICKVIISIGNHEFYIEKKNKLFGLNTKFLNRIKTINNVYLLNNESTIIDSINFIGITVPIEYYSKIDDNYEYFNKIKVEDKCYNILLCHNPIKVCTSNILKNKNIDLALCGHMHGGIVPRFLRLLFKTRGIIGPGFDIFPKYCYGKLKVHDKDVIITSGCRVLPFKVINKLFNIEIVVINLTNRKKQV